MANSKTPLSELTLLGHIHKVVSDAKMALAEMPKASRWFHIFWLLGPLILLIERSPADAWRRLCIELLFGYPQKRRELAEDVLGQSCVAFGGSVCSQHYQSYLLILGEALSGYASRYLRWPAVSGSLLTNALYAMMGMTMLGMIIMTGINSRSSDRRPARGASVLALWRFGSG